MWRDRTVHKLIGALILAGLGGPGSVGAEDAELGRNAPSIVEQIRAERRSRERLVEATQTLVEEFEAHRRDPSFTLRIASDYFAADGAAIAPAVLLEALRRPVADDIQLDCYVKWQLLSAIEKFPADLSPDALALYRNSPRLTLRPGIDQRQRQDLDQLALRVRQEPEVDRINRELDSAVEAVAAENRLLLLYRDTLYAKLPAGMETFTAAIEDLIDRLEAGVVSSEFLDARLLEVRQWAAESHAGLQQRQALAGVLGRLRRYDGPQYHSELDWSNGRAVWRKKRDGYGRSRKLKDLIDELQGPPGPLPGNIK